MRKLSLGDSLRIRREGTADSRVDLIDDSSAIIPWRNRPIRNIILCGLLLIAMIAVGTSIMVTNFRNRELADNERELKNVALIVAEQTDRSFQSLELVLTSVIERMQSLGIASSEDFERQMSSQDVQLMLKDKISALPHIEAVTLINADGKIINFSRFWPTPDINIANRKHFIAFKSDPQLISFISEPVLNRATGTWSVFLMRKFTAPNGEFVGLVHGAVELKYFEKFFASILLGEQSSVALYRGDGVLLARYPRVNSAIGKTFIQAVKAIGDDDGGTVRYIGAMEGKDRILAAHRVAHYPLHISAAKDTDAVLASWRTETRSLLGAGGLGVLAITGMIVLIVRQDSQAHKRSKKRLALEKQRLSTAVNNMTQGLLMFDADEKIAIVNQRYIEMYGVSPDVVKPGCSFRELINHRREAGASFGDIDQYCDRIIAKITAKETTNLVMEGADGRTISIVSRPLSDGGWVATYEDITEARRREESFRLLFESNPVAMLVIDRASMRFLAVNDAAITHYGYSREQFMSMMATDLRPAEDRESADQYLKTISADEISGNNARHVKADGTRIDVCMYSRILTYEGQSARLSAVHDVTDRERALDELSRTQAFLDAIVENMPTPIIVKDVRGHRYTLVNRATEACFGIPRGEMIGKSVHELFQKEEADAIVILDNEALRSDRPLITDTYPLHTPHNGIRLLTATRLAVRGNSGSPQYILTVIEDVTERKNVEAQLRQAQKMEAIGNLTGGVAHDFNNLLTIMVGNLDLLLEENAEWPQIAQRVDVILEAALRGAELTRQMLAFSRRQPLQPKCIDVNALVDKTTRLLARTLGEEIRIELRKSPVPCEVNVDEAQLEAALLNIAINSRDAMPNGGTLTVAIDKVIFCNEDVTDRPGLAAGEHISLKIGDTGGGIPDEIISHIFEPFFTTKETGKGTGLGLSMVYGFVKQSGGYVGVTSTPGAGTTFELCFPVIAATAFEANLNAASNGNGIVVLTGAVVLAVDDQAEVRATAVAHLTALGYQVLEADCAQAALDKLAAGAKIDLLFTDIVMPGGLDGIELARVARVERPDLKVLYTSGYPGTETVDGSARNVDGALIAKPYRKQELAKAVAEVLAAA